MAFDSFFARYPYCYGYWKKYADLEKKAGNVKTAEEVNGSFGGGFPSSNSPLEQLYELANRNCHSLKESLILF